MISHRVLSLLAVVLFASTLNAFSLAEHETNLDNFDSKENELVQDQRPRLLNVANKLRPYCMSAVETVQSAPSVCDNVSGYIVDAATAVCQESFREFCRIAMDSTYACDGIISYICPKRETVEGKIKESVHKYCEMSLQKLVDQFGKLASNFDKESMCGTFVEGVRETCHEAIIDYCSNNIENTVVRSLSVKLLPGFICD